MLNCRACDWNCQAFVPGRSLWAFSLTARAIASKTLALGQNEGGVRAVSPAVAASHVSQETALRHRPQDRIAEASVRPRRSAASRWISTSQRSIILPISFARASMFFEMRVMSIILCDRPVWQLFGGASLRWIKCRAGKTTAHHAPRQHVTCGMSLRSK